MSFSRFHIFLSAFIGTHEQHTFSRQSAVSRFASSGGRRTEELAYEQRRPFPRGMKRGCYGGWGHWLWAWIAGFCQSCRRNVSLKQSSDNLSLVINISLVVTSSGKDVAVRGVLILTIFHDHSICPPSCRSIQPCLWKIVTFFDLIRLPSPLCVDHSLFSFLRTTCHGVHADKTTSRLPKKSHITAKYMESSTQKSST